MDKKKLIDLFNKEKQRVIENVFNPILDVINNPKYDVFFNYYLIVNINMEILKNKSYLPPISFTDFSDLHKKLQNPKYQELRDVVINKILDSYNFEIFKLVFGEENYSAWAIAFFKFIIFSYFDTQGLSNIAGQLATNTFNVAKLMNYKDNFEIFNNIIYKHIFGYSQTSIHSVEYWQRVTGISKKQHYRFFEIVNDNNPGIFLVNAFLNFHSNNKTNYYKNHIIHKYKDFSPQPKIKLIAKDLAYEWSVNYFAVLTLNSKLQIGLWKAIQNLTFGTKVGLNVVALRTVSEININLKNIWMLKKEDQIFFRNLKFQALWNLSKPKTFNEFINQDSNYVNSLVTPSLQRFVSLREKLLFNQKLDEAEKIKSDEEILKRLQSIPTEVKK